MGHTGIIVNVAQSNVSKKWLDRTGWVDIRKILGCTPRTSLSQQRHMHLLKVVGPAMKCRRQLVIPIAKPPKIGDLRFFL